MAVTKNFGKVTVSTGYDNAATSIALTTGHGAKLPAAPFWLTWWNSTNYSDPADDPNVEVVLCTVISTDTLTVTRGQQGASATNKNTGGATYKMTHGVTAYDMGFIPLVSSNSTVVYLDAVNGQDASAKKGHPGRPYSAFATAFAAMASGDTMVIMPGTYTITPVTGSDATTDTAPFKITGKTDMKFQGVGMPVIYGAGDGNWISIHNSSNIHFEGITFRGDDSHTRASTPAPIFAIFDVRPIDASTDLSWHNCRFEKYRDHGIASLFGPRPSKRMRVTDCHFTRGGNYVSGTALSDGAAIVSLGSNVVIANCTFFDLLRGVEFEGQGPHNDILVTNCSFQKLWNLCIMIFADYGNQSHFQGIVISNNSIQSVDKLNVPSGTITEFPVAIHANGGKNLVVSGNLIRNCDAGINMNSAGCSLEDVVITGNNIWATTLRPIQVFLQNTDDVAGRECQRVLISSNICQNAGDIGIRVRGREITICHNIVTDVPGSGIQLLNDGANVINPCYIRVHDNQCRNSQYLIMDYGINIQSNYTTAIVYDNDCRNVNTSGILNNGTTTTLRDNDV